MDELWAINFVLLSAALHYDLCMTALHDGSDSIESAPDQSRKMRAGCELVVEPETMPG
jgi:hypothetical protein